jgi:hypothetical protein
MVLSNTGGRPNRGKGEARQIMGKNEDRKETDLDYSTLLGCWKSQMCSLQDSELLLSPWGDHLLNQTDQAN